MSRNNIYPEMQKVFKRYAKVPVFIVAGLRLDPTDSRTQVGWTLSTSEDSFDFEGKRRTEFVYDDEVIEIYSEEEDKLFKRINKSLFSRGLLKEYNEEDLPPDLTNFMSDADIDEIVDLKTMSEFTKRLDSLTSVPTIKRIHEAALNKNKPIKKIQAIEARLKAVQDDVD